jgi:hypothetical protein
MTAGQKIRAAYTASCAEFVIAELELAITFCKVGLTTRDDERAERNADNARTALQAASRMKDRITLTKDQQQIVSSKTSQTAGLLVQLERRLTSFVP